MNNCKHCNAPEGLHHYQTLACPVGGREAPIGRTQEWMIGYRFEVEDNSAEKIRILTDAITKAENNIRQLCQLVNGLDQKSGGNGRKVRVDDFLEATQEALAKAREL